MLIEKLIREHVKVVEKDFDSICTWATLRVPEWKRERAIKELVLALNKVSYNPELGYRLPHTVANFIGETLQHSTQDLFETPFMAMLEALPKADQELLKEYINFEWLKAYAMVKLWQQDKFLQDCLEGEPYSADGYKEVMIPAVDLQHIHDRVNTLLVLPNLGHTGWELNEYDLNRVNTLPVQLKIYVNESQLNPFQRNLLLGTYLSVWDLDSQISWLKTVLSRWEELLELTVARINRSYSDSEGLRKNPLTVQKFKELVGI